MFLFADIGIQNTEESVSSAQNVIESGIEEQVEFDEERTENGFGDDVDNDHDDDDDDKVQLAIRFAPQDKTICKFGDHIYKYLKVGILYLLFFVNIFILFIGI